MDKLGARNHANVFLSGDAINSFLPTLLIVKGKEGGVCMVDCGSDFFSKKRNFRFELKAYLHFKLQPQAYAPLPSVDVRNSNTSSSQSTVSGKMCPL